MTPPRSLKPTLVLAGSLSAIVLVLLIALERIDEVKGPVPIRYGRDTCARCRMHISRPGFGAEVIDRSGRVEKYDDQGCLLDALSGRNSGSMEIYLEVMDQPGLVHSSTVTLVVGSRIETPMGYGVVSYASVRAARAFARESGGTLVGFEEALRDHALTRDRVRMARTAREGGTE